MPKWQERTRMVRTQGEIARRDWNPQPGSVHLRMYQWWQERSKHGYDRPRENFCHYWRVVMIWAPLRWLAPKLLALLIVAAVAALVIGIFVYGSTAAYIAGIVLYGLFGYDVTVYVADKFVLTNRNFEIGSIIKYDQFYKVLVALIMLVATPVIVAISAAALVVGTIVYAIYSLHADYDAFAVLRRIGRFIKQIFVAAGDSVWRAIKWLFTAHFSERWWLVWIRPFLVIPTGFAIVGLWYSWAAFVAIGIGIAIVIAIAFIRLSYLSDKATRQARSRQHESKIAECDKFFRNLFALQHPKHAEDESRYQEWFSRYRQHIWVTYGQDVYGRYTQYWYLFDRNIELEIKYTEVYGQFDGVFLGMDIENRLESAMQQRPKQKSGAVEFLAFIWSIVLVNKWKICPIVEIPERG